MRDSFLSSSLSQWWGNASDMFGSDRSSTSTNRARASPTEFLGIGGGATTNNIDDYDYYDDNGRNGGGSFSSKRRGWLRMTRQKAAMSKTGLWGPTHSLSSSSSSDEEGDNNDKNKKKKKNQKKNNNSGGDTSHLLSNSHNKSYENGPLIDADDYIAGGGEEKKFDANDMYTTTTKQQQQQQRIAVSRTTTPPKQMTLSKPEDNGTPSTKSSKEDDDDEVDNDVERRREPQQQQGDSNDNNQSFRNEPITMMQHTLGRVWNNLQCMEDTTLWGNGNDNNDNTRTVQPGPAGRGLDDNQSGGGGFTEEICPSPCNPTNLHDVMALDDDQNGDGGGASTLGISRLLPPGFFGSSSKGSNKSSSKTSPNDTTTDNNSPPGISPSHSRDAKSTTTIESAADRRRERHRRKHAGAGGIGGGIPEEKSLDDISAAQEAYEVTEDKIVVVRKEQQPRSRNNNNNGKPNAWSSKAKMTTTSSTMNKPLPMESLTLNQQKAVELERSISELTMRSSYGEATAKIAENRRMAYYAVGKHHRQSGRGGNRRCYFTGKLILGGAPFFAGSVQQGLRTLVVFCLPSAVGLPKEVQRNNTPSVAGSNGRSGISGGSSHASRRPSMSSRGDAASVAAHSVGIGGGNRSTTSLLSRKGSRLSRLSSVDDASFSVEEELDPNWELDRDYLLNVLPEPDQSLLDEMAIRYPQQFETLPVQVRSPHCWKLYVKFCFFSGLPIAEGEMHYKVRDAVADRYGEEIILSHEVMIAVNGDSAEILRLPNLKTFRYLRKHYHQQSAKLPEDCFQRQAWELVRPEV